MTHCSLGWGSYAAVLDGGSGFLYRIKVVTRRWRHLTGSGFSRPTQLAIAAGAQYSWDRAAVAPRNVLTLKGQIVLMDESGEREWLERLCAIAAFFPPYLPTALLIEILTPGYDHKEVSARSLRSF